MRNLEGAGGISLYVEPMKNVGQLSVPSQVRTAMRELVVYRRDALILMEMALREGICANSS